MSRWQPDVLYGPVGGGRRAIRLHLHAFDPGEQRPGIVLIHGGGWHGGDPSMMVPIADRLAAAGYVTAAIGYRLVSEAPWPAALDDALAAVRWMKDQAGEIGLDPDRLAVGGGSAGGQIAALVAFTTDAVRATVLYNPAVDLRANRFGMIVFGRDDPAAAAEASPITQIHPAAPPVLTLVGDRDDITPPDTCVAFHEALDAAGVANQLEIVPGQDHGLPVSDPTLCATTTADFLAKYL